MLQDILLLLNLGKLFKSPVEYLKKLQHGVFIKKKKQGIFVLLGHVK